jgi:L-ribulose-5-phosphate 4-epimerase
MDEKTARELICQTGCELLKDGLVARTWGNVSCRADKKSFLITPSGLDYLKTTPEDIVRVDLQTMKWDGRHKPSSEKGVHAAAYELFDDVNFVIHTHQNCASALGLAGFESMDISEGEREALGGIAKAEYGLPGMKKLKNAVGTAMQTGAHTVFMVNHGVVICGKDKQQTMERARLLEDICRRNLRIAKASVKKLSDKKKDEFISAVRAEIPTAELSDGEYAVMWAGRKKTLRAQLDDMAQMLGSHVACVKAKPKKVIRALEQRDAVFVRGVGAVVKADDPDDREALKILTEKSALCALHTAGAGAKVRLKTADTALMRFVYKKKYSKRKG